MTLYQKVMQGKKTTYQAWIPRAVAMDEELDDKQLITLAVSASVTCLMIMEKMLPEHARNARQIKKVHESILELAKGKGGEVDPELMEWWAQCWNQTMQSMSGRA